MPLLIFLIGVLQIWHKAINLGRDDAEVTPVEIVGYEVDEAGIVNISSKNSRKY